MRRPGTLATLLLVAACARTPAPGRPVDAAALRLDVHGHRIERVGDTLFAFGGFGARDTRVRADTLAFSLPSGPWRPRAAMNRPRLFFGSAVVAGRIYAIGDTIERYDAAHDRWTVVVGEVLMPASHFGTAAVGGRIHVLGGFPLERSGHFVFDPRAGTVERAPPPPGFAPGNHFHVVCAIGGVLHVIGGFGKGGIRDDHVALIDGTWRARAKPPVPLIAKFAAITTVGDRLFVFSMQGNAAYDAKADTWRPLDPMPADLAMPCAVVLDERILVVGGQPVGTAPESVLLYDLATDRWLPSK